MREELDARRAAFPGADWDAVEAWIERTYELTRPGGVVSMMLPDGKPFTARKPMVDNG